jgi:hypothetical protein
MDDKKNGSRHESLEQLKCKGIEFIKEGEFVEYNTNGSRELVVCLDGEMVCTFKGCGTFSIPANVLGGIPCFTNVFIKNNSSKPAIRFKIKTSVEDEGNAIVAFAEILMGYQKDIKKNRFVEVQPNVALFFDQLLFYYETGRVDKYLLELKGMELDYLLENYYSTADINKILSY